VVLARRPLVLIALLGGSGLALAASAAAVPARDAAAGVTVTGANVHAAWKEGWLLPGAAVRVTGTTRAPAHVTVTLRPLARRGIVTARTDLDVSRAGPFAARVDLPPRPLPGRYSVRVTAARGKNVLGRAQRKVTIASPVEGVVGPALVGTTPDGPWQRYDESAPVVVGSHNQLWMRFVFLSPPHEQQVEVIWKRRWRQVVGRLERPFTNTINTYARSGAPLPGGIWNVVLRVDGRVAKRMAVRLRGSPSSQPTAVTFG
jgi:hypothetical protein